MQSRTPVCNIGGRKAALLRQACVFSHAVEDPPLGQEVSRSVELCYLPLVQHQHSARREEVIHKACILFIEMHLHIHSQVDSTFFFIGLFGDLQSRSWFGETDENNLGQQTFFGKENLKARYI